MSVQIHVDTSDADRELRRLADGPDRRHLLALDTILTAQFLDTQYRVHVITGSLKASGRHDSRGDRTRWEGEISYGGPLGRVPIPGPANNPVRYARYEFGKPFDEGYDHNFLRGVLDQHWPYAEAIVAWMADE